MSAEKLSVHLAHLRACLEAGDVEGAAAAIDDVQPLLTGHLEPDERERCVAIFTACVELADGLRGRLHQDVERAAGARRAVLRYAAPY